MKTLCFLFAFLSMSSSFVPAEVAVISEGSNIPMEITVEQQSHQPTGIISNHICEEGHPYYRFSISGSSDSQFWYADHHQIFASNTSKYIVARSTSNGGFTLYCRITKIDCDGNPVVRTAYYRSHTGDPCGSGTTGYL